MIAAIEDDMRWDEATCESVRLSSEERGEDKGKAERERKSELQTQLLLWEIASFIQQEISRVSLSYQFHISCGEPLLSVRRELFTAG